MIGREARSEETSALGTIFYFVGDGITGNQLSNLLTQQIWRSDLARPYDMSIKVDIRRTKPYESCGWLLCTTNINDNKGWQQRLTTKADTFATCILSPRFKAADIWAFHHSIYTPLSFPPLKLYSVHPNNRCSWQLEPSQTQMRMFWQRCIRSSFLIYIPYWKVSTHQRQLRKPQQ